MRAPVRAARDVMNCCLISAQFRDRGRVQAVGQPAFIWAWNRTTRKTTRLVDITSQLENVKIECILTRKWWNNKVQWAAHLANREDVGGALLLVFGPYVLAGQSDIHYLAFLTFIIHE
jgi:hypothetical protein